MKIMDIGYGWIITRPGHNGDRAATWYVGPLKKDCIKDAVGWAPDPKAEWRKMQRRGYRCERAILAACFK